MQLAATGAQDVYLTGNPQMTYFKIVYRRYTNFTIESIRQNIEGNIVMGKNYTITISRNGDLLSNIWLELDLIARNSGKDLNSNFGSGSNITGLRVGHKIIKSVELEIGGQIIDTHYGDWMDIWSQLTMTQQKWHKLSRLLNGVDLVEGEVNQNENLRVKHEKKVYVPLQFWFCRNPGLSLPLIALQYHEVKLRLQLHDYEDFIPSFSSVVTTGSGAVFDVSLKVLGFVLNNTHSPDYIGGIGFTQFDENNLATGIETSFVLEDGTPVPVPPTVNPEFKIEKGNPTQTSTPGTGCILETSLKTVGFIDNNNHITEFLSGAGTATNTIGTGFTSFDQNNIATGINFQLVDSNNAIVNPTESPTFKIEKGPELPHSLIGINAVVNYSFKAVGFIVNNQHAEEFTSDVPNTNWIFIGNTLAQGSATNITFVDSQNNNVTLTEIPTFNIVKNTGSFANGYTIKVTLLNSGKGIPSGTIVKVSPGSDPTHVVQIPLSLGINLEVENSGKNYGDENSEIDVVFNGLTKLDGGISPSFKLTILGNPTFGINTVLPNNNVSGTLLTGLDNISITGSRIVTNGTFSLKTTIISGGKGIPNNTFLKITKNENDIDANNPNVIKLSLGIHLEVKESGQNYGHLNDLVNVDFEGISKLENGEDPIFKVKVSDDPFGIDPIIPTPENTGKMITSVTGASINSQRTVGGSFSLKVSVIESGKGIPGNSYLKITKKNNELVAINPPLLLLSCGINFEVIESGKNYGLENDLIDVTFGGLGKIGNGDDPSFKVKVGPEPDNGISKIIPTPESEGTLLNKVLGVVVSGEKSVTTELPPHTNVQNVDLKNMKVYGDFIFLDTDERRRFAQVSHEYLIEQLQITNSVNIKTGLNEIPIRFIHPVKELIWAIKATGNSGYNYFRATNIDADSLYDEDMIESAVLQLNGTNRFSQREGHYFRVITPYKYHKGGSLQVAGNGTHQNGKLSWNNPNKNQMPDISDSETGGFYVYSFANKPENHQPSGTCNFSKLNSAVLNFNSNKPGIIKLYGINYNVLRIMSGMGGLAFSN